MNKIILLGRLCADPEVRHTQTNKQVASFRLAVNKGGKPVEGAPTADFFNVQAWEKTADFVSKYFRKGQQVAVEGSIHNNDYTDQQGTKHFAMQVTAFQVYFADSKREAATQQEPVGPDGVGGQGYYQQPANAPEPWEQQAQQQQSRQQAPSQGQYQQAPPQQQYQQQGPGFGPQQGQPAAAPPPPQPWRK